MTKILPVAVCAAALFAPLARAADGPLTERDQLRVARAAVLHRAADELTPVLEKMVSALDAAYDLDPAAGVAALTDSTVALLSEAPGVPLAFELALRGGLLGPAKLGQDPGLARRYLAAAYFDLMRQPEHFVSSGDKMATSRLVMSTRKRAEMPGIPLDKRTELLGSEVWMLRLAPGVSGQPIRTLGFRCLRSGVAMGAPERVVWSALSSLVVPDGKAGALSYLIAALTFSRAEGGSGGSGSQAWSGGTGGGPIDAVEVFLGAGAAPQSPLPAVIRVRMKAALVDAAALPGHADKKAFYQAALKEMIGFTAG